MKQKKAIAYFSDIILGQTGDVISREYQKQQIIDYAEKNGIEILGFYEDEIYNEDVLSRPGVKAMLEDKRDYDLILVERVWTISRNWANLKELLTILRLKSVTMEATTTMWDCVSQMTRDYLRSGTVRKGLKVEKPAGASVRLKIKKPARLNFVTDRA